MTNSNKPTLPKPRSAIPSIPKVIVTTDKNKVSTGGKVCMFIGFILIVGSFFMFNPWVIIVGLAVGVYLLIQGHKMKAYTITTVQPAVSATKVSLASGTAPIVGPKTTITNKDTTSKGAV